MRYSHRTRNPDLTVAQLFVLEQLDAAPHRNDGIRVKGKQLLACRVLEAMGYAKMSTGYYADFFITPAGRKLLNLFRGYAYGCVMRGYVVWDKTGDNPARRPARKDSLPGS